MTNSARFSNSDLNNILEAPNYSLAEASRLVGISVYRVRRWLKGYEYTYKITGGNEIREGHQNAIVHFSDTKEAPYASFLDIIEMLFVKRFLDHGFSLQKIRKAIDEAVDFLGTPRFARNVFFTDGSKIYLQMSSSGRNILTLMSRGQWAIAPIIVQLSEKIDFHNVTGLATRWYPLGIDGLIVVDPQISFGRPTIMGRGITTENIYDLYLGENKQIDSVSHWLDLPKNEAQAAVEFEYSLFA
jgi:uncharacterized protein (DUF433 family)